MTMPKLSLYGLIICLAIPPAIALAGDGGSVVVAKPAGADKAKPDKAEAPKDTAPVDRSGHKQHGKASYYSRHFTHKKTASGLPLDPNRKTAASKTLPLGTKAEVTNVENGKKTEVIINDRGPYVADRVIDVTPKAAEELGLKQDGTSKVEVKPVEIPPPSADPKQEVIKAETAAEGKPPITSVAKSAAPK
jgi:rare lipoprotein A